MNGIKVYSNPGCQPCKLTKRYLSQAGVDYEDIDTSQDDEAKAYVLSKGMLSSPVVEAPDGTMFSGFRPDMLKEIVSK